MTDILSTKYRKPDYSGPGAANGRYALAGVALAAFDKTVATAQVIFPEVGVGEVNERYIYNPNAAGTITIRIRSNPSAPSVAAGGDDTIDIGPKEGWSSSSINQIDILMGATNLNISYGER
jgi:hypothetical protein